MKHHVKIIFFENNDLLLTELTIYRVTACKGFFWGGVTHLECDRKEQGCFYWLWIGRIVVGLLLLLCWSKGQGFVAGPIYVNALIP